MNEPLTFASLAAIARGDADAAWEPFREGIEILPLHGVGGEGGSAALLRYEPGAAAPEHRHTGYEHIYVLRGSQRDQRGLYPAGTLVVNPPGTTHWVASDEGCVVLIIWERPVEFIGEA